MTEKSHALARKERSEKRRPTNKINISIRKVRACHYLMSNFQLLLQSTDKIRNLYGFGRKGHLESQLGINRLICQKELISYIDNIVANSMPQNCAYVLSRGLAGSSIIN